MGNSFYHAFVHEALARHPGIVTLHDFNLAGFHWWRSSLTPEPLATFAEEVAASEPEQAAAIVPQLATWSREPGGMQEAFTRRRLYLNRRVLQHARAVVVHSPWCLERIAAQDPALARRTAVIRHGATPEPPDPARRRDARARFDLPGDALLIGCFGILAQSKMNVEAIDVFAAMRPELPAGTLLLFVGQDWENGQAQAHAQRRGLAGAVRFLGRPDDASFLDLVAAVDMAFALRRPPTYGETSGALLHLLRHGVPAIVTDTDTFADYPDSVVRKVRWETEGPAGLAVALMELATRPGRRAELSAAALAHVGQHHHWSRVAEDYVELIEAVARARSPAGAGRPQLVPPLARLAPPLAV
jgi:glycosyltransferase involved in cell wall biosynthesis